MSHHSTLSSSEVSMIQCVCVFGQVGGSGGGDMAQLGLMLTDVELINLF